ncbi:MFS general substrate transporter [Delitschia confertaspora ATCC 74209]|uniref:MFS general substrate transporter n=1 Tax=Delitschia confertaspora ATCC 74209 TaxID=1513339 RepID=A0A9P4JTH8_9PLEO|nr:MFS general substrate transporter [Delitschia confertaspora ATCC 74209]
MEEQDAHKPDGHFSQLSSTESPILLDWDGPNDPDNPRNWSLWQRTYHTAVPSVMCFIVSFGTSVYTPSVSEISLHFRIPRTLALIPLTVYVLGLAFGPLISAPISETHGRKIVYLISLPISMLFTLGAGLSKEFASLVICRFFAGLFGSPVLAVGAGTNADLFMPAQRAVATSMFMVAPFLGPSLGPFIGGFAAQYKGWRWTQWCMLFIAAPTFVTSLFMKETYKKIVLKKRAKRLGLPVPESGPTVTSTLSMTLFRPIHMLLTEPIVTLLSLYTAYTFATLFAFFAAFPLIFSRPPYFFTISQVGLTFLAIGLGVCLGCMTAIIVDRKVYQKKHRKALEKGERYVLPEQRLWAAMVGSFGLPIGLFWFGWSAGTGVHWGVPVVGAVWFAWGNMSLFICTALYLVDVYGPLNGASAMAANGMLRYLLGAVFPLFTVQMYQRLGATWATSLLGFLSLFMLPIPWVFYKWGPAIRKQSRYPTAM